VATGESCGIETQLLLDARGRVATCFFLGEVGPFSYMSVVGIRFHVSVRRICSVDQFLRIDCGTRLFVWFFNEWSYVGESSLIQIAA
jgi:hypothetical protein